MSVCATMYVWKLTKEKVTSTEKLVLLSMADRANEAHECWPSKVRLAADTLLDLKTVKSAISKLVDKGILVDTGEKKGKLKRISVYKIIGVDGREEAHNPNRPNIGTIKNETEVINSNRPETGTINRPNIGTINRPKNGSLNLSVEPISRTYQNTHSADAPISEKICDYVYPETYYPQPVPTEPPQPPVTRAKSSFSDLIQDNPHCIPEGLLKEWKQVRRKPITPTVWRKLNEEIVKCKCSPIEAIEEMISRGWVTLKAEWINKNTTKEKNNTLDHEDTSWMFQPRGFL